MYGKVKTHFKDKCIIEFFQLLGNTITCERKKNALPRRKKCVNIFLFKILNKHLIFKQICPHKKLN